MAGRFAAQLHRYASWSRVRRADNPDAYLRRIVVNANRNRFRKVRVGEVLTDAVPDLISARTALISGRTGTRWSGLFAVASGVRAVALRYSDGSTARFPAVEVSGDWLVACAIPARLSVVSSEGYGAAGQVIGRTGGKTWGC